MAGMVSRFYSITSIRFNHVDFILMKALADAFFAWGGRGP